MNKSIIAALLAASITSGCSTTPSTMPDSSYNIFSGIVGYSRQCFEKGYMSAQLYADVQDSLAYSLSTWSYDADRLSKSAAQKYSDGSTSAANCRDMEVVAYRFISTVKDDRGQRQRDASAINELIRSVNSSIGRPIFCNRIGNSTVCN